MRLILVLELFSSGDAMPATAKVATLLLGPSGHEGDGSEARSPVPQWVGRSDGPITPLPNQLLDRC
ncbi:methionine--tRNA ligase [Synechococcus sp. BL107]|nr:methionine--tRNA ligase [Synechococcus sp. BL107]